MLCNKCGRHRLDHEGANHQFVPPGDADEYRRVDMGQLPPLTAKQLESVNVSIEQARNRQFAENPPDVEADLAEIEAEEREDMVTEIVSEHYESVNHPAHYGGDTTYEAIKVIEAHKLSFSLGNAVKYILRAGKKPGVSPVQDLEKALWYLKHEIKRLNGESPQA